MIRITAEKDGFRRCGIAHGKVPTDYPDDHFTEQELEQLLAEPALLVEHVDAEKPKSPKK